MLRFVSIFRRLFKMDHEIEARNADTEEQEEMSPARNELNSSELAPLQCSADTEEQEEMSPARTELNSSELAPLQCSADTEEQEEMSPARTELNSSELAPLQCSADTEEQEEMSPARNELNSSELAPLQHRQWVDLGYVEPKQEVKCQGLAILDANNYGGFQDLDVNMAKLHFEHELPPGYSIVRRIGRGAFGCCFVVQKQTDPDLVVQPEKDQLVLKVVRGMIEPRRPVLFYKTCSIYTIMISLKAIPLVIENLKFILAMLKFHHTEYADIHGDLHPGNMMYSWKDITRPFWMQVKDCWPRETWTKWPQAILIHALFDFVDHWFSTEDDQYAFIIDSDIGGKIGKPKIIVNHQHHDPRNATWQVSDDLIGLMNWVVIKTGHCIESHCARGIVYNISLKSLKRLHAHIIGVYEDLDNHFMYKYLQAPCEPFKLKLQHGNCYLDELLEGMFLTFESYKGSYFRATTTSTVTSCIKLQDLEVTQAVPVTLEDLYQDVFSKITSHNDKYLSNLIRVTNLLTSTTLHGGVVFVVLDKKHKNDLQILSLDNGLLTKLCRCHAKSVHKPLFMHLLHSFCIHSETDRWERSLLEQLARNFSDRSQKMSEEFSALEMQPKDGAFVLSCSGTVLAAAAHLKFVPQHYKLCKPDGTCFGTRHAAALATAEWMRMKGVNGNVFVRSDAGGVHVILPHGQTSSVIQNCPSGPWVTEDGQKLPQVLYIKSV